MFQKCSHRPILAFQRLLVPYVVLYLFEYFPEKKELAERNVREGEMRMGWNNKQLLFIFYTIPWQARGRQW